MPIYQYHCTSCGADLEIFQRMTDPTLTVCPDCDGALKKIFSPVGIVFKGSGFYATDSKKSSSSTKTATPRVAASSESGAGSSSESSSTDSSSSTNSSAYTESSPSSTPPAAAASIPAPTRTSDAS